LARLVGTEPLLKLRGSQIKMETSSCCGVTPEHGWRRRAQDNALRRDLSESGLHVVDSLKLPPLSCDDLLKLRGSQIKMETSSCCGVTPEHGWRRRAQDNALRRDLSESGLHVADALKLPPLSCDDRFEVRR
jgi:hypothetical protein